MRIDLHVHSDYSDGSFSPEELAQEAVRNQVTAFALTDHDTLDGVREAMEAGRRYGIQVIPGIELSAVYGGQDIHILGLNPDIDQPEFLWQLEHYRQERDRRNQAMLDRMIACGLPVEKEEFAARYPKSVITRAHFAEYLLEKGSVSSMKEAFDRYLGPGRPCYLAKKTISCQEAVSCIRRGNGHPVLAHPWQYKLPVPQLKKLILELMGYDLEGLEAVYTTHTQDQERKLRSIAAEFGLKVTGGSDFHRSKKPDIRLGYGRGSLYVHHEMMEWLFNKRKPKQELRL